MYIAAHFMRICITSCLYHAKQSPFYYYYFGFLVWFFFVATIYYSTGLSPLPDPMQCLFLR